MSKTVGNYVIQSKVGSGSYAQVYRAIHRSTNETFAIKMIAKEKLGNDERLYANLESEIRIMRDYIHPNVVRLYENLTSGRNIYLVLEYCPGGDLTKFIRKNHHLSDQVARVFFVQLVDGLAFLHSRNVIHRDIKPQNILLTEATTNATIKIADFGFAKHLTEASMAQTPCGTPLYMAPEIFEMKEYNEKADLWSLGCVYYEMLVGTTPFKGSSPKELYNNIQTRSLSFPNELQVSRQTEMLLKKLLEREPKYRSTLAEISAICTEMKSSGILNLTAEMSASDDQATAASSTGSGQDPTGRTAGKPASPQSGSANGAAAQQSSYSTPPVAGIGAAFQVAKASAAVASPNTATMLSLQNQQYSPATPAGTLTTRTGTGVATAPLYGNKTLHPSPAPTTPATATQAQGAGQTLPFARSPLGAHGGQSTTGESSRNRGRLHSADAVLANSQNSRQQNISSLLQKEVASAAAAGGAISSGGQRTGDSGHPMSLRSPFSPTPAVLVEASGPSTANPHGGAPVTGHNAGLNVNANARHKQGEVTPTAIAQSPVTESDPMTPFRGLASAMGTAMFSPMPSDSLPSDSRNSNRLTDHNTGPARARSVSADGADAGGSRVTTASGIVRGETPGGEDDFVMVNVNAQGSSGNVDNAGITIMSPHGSSYKGDRQGNVDTVVTGSGANDAMHAVRLLPAFLPSSPPNVIARHIQALYIATGVMLDSISAECEQLYSDFVVNIVELGDAQVRDGLKELGKLHDQQNRIQAGGNGPSSGTSIGSVGSTPPFALSSSASPGGPLLPGTTPSSTSGGEALVRANSINSTPAADQCFASAQSLYVHACMLLYPILFNQVPELLQLVVDSDAEIANGYVSLLPSIQGNPHKQKIIAFAETLSSKYQQILVRANHCQAQLATSQTAAFASGSYGSSSTAGGGGPSSVTIPVAEILMYKASMQYAMDANVAEWLGHLKKASRLYLNASRLLECIVLTMRKQAAENDCGGPATGGQGISKIPQPLSLSSQEDMRILVHFSELFRSQNEVCIGKMAHLPDHVATSQQGVVY